MTDNDIIKGIRDNSPEAWRELYHATVGGIRSKIEPMLIRVKHLTFDDVFEEACITLMNHIKDGKVVESEHTNLSGFLYTICWRIALRQNDRESLPKEEPAKSVIKVNNRQIVFEPSEEQGEDPNKTEEDEKQVSDFLDRALNSIPVECQKLLRRYYWDKMSMRDIAPTLGLKNENVAKTKKNRCMDKFKGIVKAMLADDEKADEAVRRTIERNALRDLLQDLRMEESGEIDLAALKDKEDT